MTVSRTLSYSNGGQGGIDVLLESNGTAGPSTLITVNTTCSLRIPIRLAADTTQWRLKLRNYNSLTSTAQVSVTMDKIVKGVMAAPVSGVAQTGTFAGSTATTIDTAQTIPGDGSYYTSPWVTAPADQFADGQDHLIGIGFHTSASTSMLVGIGQCWRWTTTAGTDPTVAGSAAATVASYIPIDWVLEYQTTNSKHAYLIVGDSISEGTAGAPGTLASPTPLWHGFWDQWARRRGDMMVQKHALYASLTQTWASPTYTGWTRQSTTGGLYDGAVIALGANDIPSGRTLAQLQADYASVIANVQAIVQPGAPIYAVNVLPENLPSIWGSTYETVRLNFNNWLAQLPAGIAAMVNAEVVMRTSSASAIDSALQTGDNVHPSYAGQAHLTDLLLAAIP